MARSHRGSRLSTPFGHGAVVAVIAAVAGAAVTVLGAPAVSAAPAARHPGNRAAHHVVPRTGPHAHPTQPVSSPPSHRPGFMPTVPQARALRQAQAGRSTESTATAATTATGPMTLTYGNTRYGPGAMPGTPKVYLVYWGSQWGVPGTDADGDLTLSNDPYHGAPYLQRLFRGLGTAGETWSGTLTQYCDGTAGLTSCAPSVPHVDYPNGGALAGVWYDDAAPEPATAPGRDIRDEAVRAATHFGNTSLESNSTSVYFVLSATGLNPASYIGNACAWHSSTYTATHTWVAYVNLPYLMDVGSMCGMGAVNYPGHLDGYSIAAGHEYAETLTNEDLSFGWVNRQANSPYDGFEVGDECVWVTGGPGAPADLVTSTGSFAMQTLFSNDTNRCDFTHPVRSGPGNVVTVHAPATVRWPVGTAMATTVTATDSQPVQTYSYSASGLPPGLSIDGTTGRISGTPLSTGVFDVIVSAVDRLGVLGSATIGWEIAGADGVGGTIAAVRETPGLPVTITLTPIVPAGLTLHSVAWHAARSDCAITDSSGNAPGIATVQVLLGCDAGDTGTTSVAATVTDSAGVSDTVFGAVTFVVTKDRPVTLRVAVDGQLLGTPSAPTVCDGLPSTVRATVVDVATGAPVKGYLLVVSQQPTPPTSPTLLSRSVTDVSGGTRDDHVLAAATTYTVAGPAQGSFQGAGATGQVVPITCVTALDGTAVSSLSPAYGTVVTVRGSLHRPAGATSIGIAGQLVTVTLTTPAHGTTPAATRTLSSARTSADSGDPNFALAFQASTSGELRLTYLASRGATAASVDLGPLTVAIPNTTLTARASTDHVRAGQPVSVTGTLTTAGVAIPGASITVYLVPASGAAILIGTATVTSTGTYTLTAPVFGAGTLVAGYAGGARLSAARAVAGKVTIDT